MKTKVQKPKKIKTRVTSISVGATYNLGNYENVRYDVSAEVGEGESAMAAFQELRAIVATLKPIRSPSCLEDYKTACSKEEAQRTNWEKEHIGVWADQVATWNHRKVMRADAIAALDTLGGNSKFRDAKQSWESESDDTHF